MISIITPEKGALGIADGFNLGAEKATGDYFLFCRPTNKVCDLADVEKYLKRDEPPWCYGRIELVDKQGRSLARFAYYPHKWWRHRREQIIPLSATIISRELFVKSGGFRTDLRTPDFEFTLRLSTEVEPIAITNLINKVEPESLSYHEKLAHMQENYHIRNDYFRAPLDRLLSYRTYHRQLKRILSREFSEIPPKK